MDIKQQTKNVAAQGRFGDSMLLHVNPEEVKGLASAMPITINPETGQPEAFLPFLAPVLGSLIAPTILAGTGLSAAAMAGIGAGLATYAQTGGSGSKALISGLTAGLGSKALSGGAEAAVGADAATQAATTGADIATQTAARDAAISAAQEGAKLTTEAGFRGFTPGESLKTMFGNRGLDAGIKSLGSAAMTPTGMLASTAAGTGAVIQSQEEFERQMAQMQLDEEERKKRMYEMYPEQIPVASGGKIGFQRGSFVNRFQDAQQNVINQAMNPNLTGQYRLPARRTARPIGRGFMPGFMPEYSYFENTNPSATALGFNPLSTSPINFNQPTRGFRNIRPMPPRRDFRFRRPPMFAGYGNPFMQSPSYQGFYGVPQMQQTLNPYARFTQQPLPYQPYVPYVPPVDTPPDDGGGTGGGQTPPIDPPIDIPDDGIGRKGRTRNIIPTSSPDEFVTTGPVNKGPRPIERAIRPTNTPPPTITVPIEGGADVKIPDFSKINTPITPPMIGGLEDRDAMRDEMSIDRGLMINENPVTFTPPVTPPPVTPPTLPTPAAPANTPMQKPMSIGGPGGGRNDMFGRSMLFAEGEDTNKELPNEGLKALAKTEKGREAIEKMGYQEGQDINMPTGQSTDMMMQDPIVQEVIQFILGETDDSNIVNEFIIKYGQEQFMILRNMILTQASGNPNVQTEGLIQGTGRSGMADDLPMNIGNKPIAAVSQDEYIIPADVVSMLGDGSSDAGSKQLDGMLDRIRMAKTGGKTQAPPLNPEEVLPA